MLFFSSNTTNETANETAENQSSGKMGILKNIAVIAGTAAGIGGVIFGAKKLHDHFSQDYLEDFDDFFEEDEESDVTENEAPVEDFTEVDTEETEDIKPVEEMSASEIGNNKSMPITERISILGDRVKQFKFDIRDGYNAVSDKVNSVSEELFELWRHRKDYQLYNLSLADMKAIDDIIDEFSDEYIKFIETLHRIAERADYETLRDMKREFAEITYLCWTFVSARCQYKVKRLNAFIDKRMIEENSKKSEGETKTSDKNCFDVFKEDHKETNKAEDEISDTHSGYMDDCNVIIEAMSDADATNFQRNKCVRMLENIASDKSVFPETLADAFVMAKETTCYHIRSWACNMQERVKDADVDTLTHIDHHVKTLIITIGNAEHLKVESSFAACTYLLKTLSISINDHIYNLSAGENQTAEKPLTYPMAEKVAEAVKAGDEIQAPVAATNASEKEAQEIMRIINDIPERETPEKNDLRCFARCIGGHVAKINTEEISEEILADLRNSIVVFTYMIDTAIEHLSANSSSDVYTLGNMHQMRDEFAASNTLNILGKGTAETMLQSIDDKISAFSEMLKSSNAETAAAQAPEEPAGLPVDITSEVNELGAKLKQAGELIKAEKWSDAKEFYKSQLTPYLADDNLSEELRRQIADINTKATNQMMSAKQLENKKAADAKKAGKKKSGKKAYNRHGKR